MLEKIIRYLKEVILWVENIFYVLALNVCVVGFLFPQYAMQCIFAAGALFCVWRIFTNDVKSQAKWQAMVDTRMEG